MRNERSILSWVLPFRGNANLLVAVVVFSLGAFPKTAWSQCEAELIASDEAENDNAGQSVSISGDTAVIGAWTDDTINGENSGSAYVFTKSGSNWIEKQKLVASDGAPLDDFGTSVAIDGNVIIIGAEFDRDNGTASGSAYVFRWNGLSWVEEQKLIASDGASNDRYGWSVGISGDTIIVGAHNNGNRSLMPGDGAAYVYRYNGTTWAEEQKLIASDAEGDKFGFSLAISGNVAIVGAYLDEDNGFGSGSAYVFRRSGSNWVQEQKLLPLDGTASTGFGYAVALFGNLAVVGVHGDDAAGINFGSAYVFRFNGSTWVEEAKLYGSDSATFDRFAWSVSVGDDVAVIGAPNVGRIASHINNGHGAVYVFRKNGPSWVEEQKLVPSDSAGSNFLGTSVSLSGDEMMAGAPGNRDNVWGAGSAYVFQLLCAPSGCAVDSECDDADACTADTCDGGACSNTQIACDDGDACTTADRCSGGTCSGTPVDCDDGIECTVESCDFLAGCDHSPDDALCDDGMFCNGLESCDSVLGCQDGVSPFANPLLPFCNEDIDECVSCLSIGDHNGDGVINLQDFFLLFLCQTGPVGPIDPPTYPSECRCLDADDDGDIDRADFANFQRDFSG